MSSLWGRITSIFGGDSGQREGKSPANSNGTTSPRSGGDGLLVTAAEPALAASAPATAPPFKPSAPPSSTAPSMQQAAVAERDADPEATWVPRPSPSEVHAIEPAGESSLEVPIPPAVEVRALQLEQTSPWAGPDLDAESGSEMKAASVEAPSPPAAAVAAPIPLAAEGAQSAPVKASPARHVVQARGGGDYFEPLWRRLLKEEVSPEVAERIVQAARAHLPAERRSDPSGVWAAATRALVDLVPTAGAMKVRRDRCTVVALVGPTGVGKSTTLAKLAAIAALKERRTVAIITTDTYRVAATEQVKVYGRLLRIPVVVARSAEELNAALERHRFRDLLLVDTAGQSPNDTGRLADLGSLMGEEHTIRRLLVLSATTKTRDAREITKRFGRLGLDGLLFTKLDESSSHGVIVDSAISSGLALTYFGLGQAVPQDIEVASAARVVSLLLPLEGRAPASEG